MDAAAEVPPPPQPVAPSRKRCPHDYASKKGCPICNPCAGGHGKVKWNCGICTGNVEARDHAALKAEKLARPGVMLVPAAKGKKCTHTYLKPDNTLSNYSNKRHCAICMGCGHGPLKQNCPICHDCGHRKLKYNCNICSPCKHGDLKGHCASCKSESRLVD